MQFDVASATRAPWIVANGWRFLRNPGGKYLYELPAGKAALGLAEAYAYGVDAGFLFDAADAGEAARMVSFLRALPERSSPALADFAFLDDGSEAAGEAMNLMSRRNLLFAVFREAEPRFQLTIIPGSEEFPKKLIANPANFAAAVRQKLTDDKRSLRIYGTQMAIVRAEGDGKTARVDVLNYNTRPLDGVRLRVRGVYSKAELHAFGYPEVAASEFTVDEGFTEFSIPQMGAYAIVDLR
jgi:hypothetical protein